MSHFSRQFPLEKPYKQLHKLQQDCDFSFQFKPLSDHPLEDIDNDDWEFIEVLDKQLAATSDGDDGEPEMYDPVEAEDSPNKFFHFTSLNEAKYRILSKADVRKRLEDKVTSVSVVLSLSRNDSLLLLHCFKWDARRTQEEWLTREEKVRSAVGLLEKPVMEVPDNAEILCALCLEKADAMHAVSCGHQICRGCWTDYISMAISKGPSCLALRCPATSCEAAVGIEMIELVATLEDKKKFDDYLLKSSVTSSRKGKCCPALECEFAIFAPAGSEVNNDVTCRCLHSFCWNCFEEAHGPVHCGTVSEWMSEIILQTDNWLLANTRPCPGCEGSIATDSYQICSRCTVGNCFLTDNLTEPATESSTWDDRFYIPELSNHGLDWQREKAEKSLARFNQYYEGWSSSEAARSNALSQLKLLQDVQLGMLCEILSLQEKDCNFVVDAQVQVVHCWRFLKWMHVYGYYLPEHENSKRGLFEFMQDQSLRLVKMLERHVDELLKFEDLCLDHYMNCRQKLLQLTRITRIYNERCKEALKSGLSEVESSSEAQLPQAQPSPRRE